MELFHDLGKIKYPGMEEVWISRIPSRSSFRFFMDITALDLVFRSSTA